MNTRRLVAIDSRHKTEDAFDSMPVSAESALNEIEESDSQKEKHDGQRI
jgi:hypothetical protein